MALQDRTAEFLQASSTAASRIGKPLARRSQNDSRGSQYATVAAQIGRETYEATQKLERLLKLAKSSSPFDDPEIEIQNLTVASFPLMTG